MAYCRLDKLSGKVCVQSDLKLASCSSHKERKREGTFILFETLKFRQMCYFTNFRMIRKNWINSLSSIFPTPHLKEKNSDLRPSTLPCISIVQEAMWEIRFRVIEGSQCQLKKQHKGSRPKQGNCLKQRNRIISLIEWIMILEARPATL